jgi:hypothetical protein
MLNIKNEGTFDEKVLLQKSGEVSTFYVFFPFP